jgi:hypothetical protein
MWWDKLLLSFLITFLITISIDMIRKKDNKGNKEIKNNRERIELKAMKAMKALRDGEKWKISNKTLKTLRGLIYALNFDSLRGRGIPSFKIGFY